MKLAELFINLGVKGVDATQNALGGVKKSVSEVSSMSLEAKAAIVGIFYGLERLMTGAGELGTNLSNFNAITGQSTTALQQWQYAAIQGGASADEMASSLKAVQQTMSDVIFKRKQVEGMGPLMATPGFDPKKSQDPFHIAKQTEEMLKRYSVPVGNSLARSLGFSDNIIGAMRKGVFNEANFSKAPTLNEKQIGSLNRMDIGLSNLGQKIKMAMANFSSKHGEDMVNNLTKLTDQIFRLVDALTALAEKLKVFKILSESMEGITAGVQLLRAMNAIFTGDTKEQKKIQKELGGGSNKQLQEAYQRSLKNFNEGGAPKGLFEFLGEMMGSKKDEMVAPKTPSTVPPQSSNGNGVEFNQTFNFQHDGKNAQQVGQSVQQGVMNAFRQSPAQLQRI